MFTTSIVQISASSGLFHFYTPFYISDLFLVLWSITLTKYILYNLLPPRLFLSGRNVQKFHCRNDLQLFYVNFFEIWKLYYWIPKAEITTQTTTITFNFKRARSP